MPMRSQAQRRFLHARHPDIARRFEEHTPPGVKLPERVKTKAEKKARDLLANEVQQALPLLIGQAKQAACLLIARLRAGTALKSAIDTSFGYLPANRRLSLENSIVKLAAFKLKTQSLSSQNKSAGLASAFGAPFGAPPSSTIPVDEAISSGLTSGAAGLGLGGYLAYDRLKQDDPGLIRSALLRQAGRSGIEATRANPSVRSAIKPLGSIVGGLLRYRRLLGIPAAGLGLIGAGMGYLNGRSAVNAIQNEVRQTR